MMAEPENVPAEQQAEPPAAGDAAPSPAWESRRLLRAARAGTLATSAGGQPFASLVTPACAPDLSLLMLLSSLSEHTRHLRADPRCAIMVMGAATSANPQTAPRVTVTGLAEPEPDPALKARWLAIHPYAALYADFGDFSLWRVRPMAAQLVGGFARAARVRQADLLPDPAAVAALAEAEPRIVAHCNADHPDAMDAIARTAGGSGSGWKMVTADVDGCDLWREEQVLRAHWAAPVASGEDVRRETIRLTRASTGASFG
jgi:putative heme iron utilization protein